MSLVACQARDREFGAGRISAELASISSEFPAGPSTHRNHVVAIDGWLIHIGITRIERFSIVNRVKVLYHIHPYTNYGLPFRRSVRIMTVRRRCKKITERKILERSVTLEPDLRGRLRDSMAKYSLIDDPLL